MSTWFCVTDNGSSVKLFKTEQEANTYLGVLIRQKKIMQIFNNTTNINSIVASNPVCAEFVLDALGISYESQLINITLSNPPEICEKIV